MLFLLVIVVGIVVIFVFVIVVDIIFVLYPNISNSWSQAEVRLSSTATILLRQNICILFGGEENGGDSLSVVS